MRYECSLHGGTQVMINIDNCFADLHFVNCHVSRLTHLWMQ